MDSTGDLLSSSQRNAGRDGRGSPRRLLLLILVLASAWAATDVFASVLATDRLSYLDLAILGMFFLSFAWISSAFWTALAGFFTIWPKSSKFPGLTSIAEVRNSECQHEGLGPEPQAFVHLF